MLSIEKSQFKSLFLKWIYENKYFNQKINLTPVFISLRKISEGKPRKNRVIFPQKNRVCLTESIREKTDPVWQ